MYVKFDFNTLCKKILDENFGSTVLNTGFEFGEVEFYESLTQEQHRILKKTLKITE
jgi:hypothetical protein